MKNFLQQKKNLKKDFSNLKAVKLAVLGDTPTQLLVQALRGTAYDYEIDLQIWEADYDQIELQISDPDSALYQFGADVILLFQSSNKLLDAYNKLNPADYSTLADDMLARIEAYTAAIQTKTNASVIYYNYPEINDAVFGSYANKHEASFLFQLRKLNYGLMQYAARNANFYLCDISAIQNLMGRPAFFQSSVYINTGMVLSIDALPQVAALTLDIIAGFNGSIKKCVVIDLDNTIWGGVIGDDGIENIQLGGLGIGKAFSEFQYWLKKLKNRGIILAVCSQNTASVAKEPFEKHPDMVLKLDDIAVFVANWENKVDNIKSIQKTLNIGFDSMVFLDDNPFERHIVREHIPRIVVPELPEDPADYLEYLYALNLFETTAISKEDEERTKLYQLEAQRTGLHEKFNNEADFLASLNMRSAAEPFSKFSIPRVAQLSQRSNQFNLRTMRYSEAEIAAIAQNDVYYTLSFTLEDKFGDNGLISAVILRKDNANTLFIDTWIMSCRVLKRSMENFVLNTLASFALENGFNTLTGEYLPTAKNELVKDHYEKLGFEKKGNHWTLDLCSYNMRETFINQSV